MEEKHAPHCKPSSATEILPDGSAEYMQIDTGQIYTWTHSSMAFSWINALPNKTLETYVKHRVSDIVSHVPASQWRYVSTDHGGDFCAILVNT